MASIATSIEIYDRATQPLNMMVSALQATVKAFASVNSAMDSGMDTSSIEQARQAIEDAVSEVNDLHSAIQQANSETLSPAVQVEQIDIPQTVSGTEIDLQVNVPDVNIPAPDPVELPVEPNVPSPVVPDPEPVTVPVEWQADNLEVFTNTGVERFEQEIQSANNMMQTLVQNQQRITQTASGMTILPASAQSDISGINDRLTSLQQKLQQLENTPVSLQTTEVNNQIEQLRSQLDSAIDAQNELNSALDNMDAEGANRAYMRLSQTVSGTERYIRDNTTEQGYFNQAIQQGVSDASSLNNMLGKAVATLGAFFGVRKIFSFVKSGMELFDTQLNAETQLMTVLANMLDDDYVLEIMAEADTSAAISEINAIQNSVDDTVTLTLEARTEALQRQFDSITAKASEIQSRGIYGDEAMIAGAAELSTYFTDTDAIELMMDTLSDYAMGMSGGGALDSTAMVDYATGLGKIMSGAYDAMTKKGFEFTEAQKAVIEGTATEAEYAAVLGDEYVNMSEDMRAATAITQVVEESWAGLYETMSNTPEGKIIQMTNAFGDLNEMVGQQLYPYIILIVDTINENWTTIEAVIQGVADGIGFILGLIDMMIQGIVNVANFFSSNWSIIAPIIYGIVTALAAYLIVAGIVNTVNGIMAASEATKAAAQMMATGATFAETAAQYGLNAALAACPLTWIIALIIALIAVIYAVCQAIAKMTGAANTGFGIIAGGINVVIQFFKNLGLTVANIALGIGNAIAALAGNMMTAFNNAICSIQSWFYNLLSTALSVIEGICAALNRLPFVEFDYSGITAAADDYAAKAAEAAGNKQEYQSISDAFAEGFSTFDTFQDGWAADAFASGAAWGDGVMDGLSSFLDGFGDLMSVDIPEQPGVDAGSILSMPGVGGGGYDASQIPSNIADTAGNTARAADSLDITDEDLKYLRDIAERDVINRFTTAEISVDMGGVTNNVNSEVDLDGIVDYLANSIQEAMEVAAEGVHV